MVEAAAENQTLMEKYLEGAGLSEEREILEGLRLRT